MNINLLKLSLRAGLRTCFLAGVTALAAEEVPHLSSGTAAAHFPVTENAPAAAPLAGVQPVTYSALLGRVMPAVVSVFLPV